MNKLSQGGMMMPSTNTQEPIMEGVQENPEIAQQKSEEKAMKDRQIRALNIELRLIQEKLRMLQTAAKAQKGQFDDLNRQEDAEQESQDQQQDVNVVNQLMQQQQQQNQNTNTQLTMLKQSRRWIRSEIADAKIGFIRDENRAAVYCDVAATPLQQASGLQPYEDLGVHRGLWFPQHVRRIASFHMGSVKFPIDIIFVDQNKINKIVASISPGQFGSWSSICTDVIEVNGGWSKTNSLKVGDIVKTPINKRQSMKSYDQLRTLTEASSENWEEDLLETFPFLKSAQENKDIKPMTFNRSPGEIDGRNPTDRFQHETLPDEFSPFGDGGSTDVDSLVELGNGGQSSGGTSLQHFQYTNGLDPSLDNPDRVKIQPMKPGDSGLVAPIRHGAKTDINIDPKILANGSIQLFDMYPPQWNLYNAEENKETALISDKIIEDWTNNLGFESRFGDVLHELMLTNDYKMLLGEALKDAGKIEDYHMSETDGESTLELYR